MAEHTERLRVLVVDDEPGIVDVVSMALRHHGFEVATVQTGAEALAQVRDWRPHAIVLDIMLPDMEGFEVAQRLAQQRAQVPILFLSARDNTSDKVRGLTSGGDDYVTKPFSLEELVARLRNLLRRSGAFEQAPGRCASPTSSSTRTPARSVAARTRSSSPPPSTGSCATCCSTRGES